MNKTIATLFAFFAGMFSRKTKAPTKAPSKRPARIEVYSAPMNRAKRRLFAHRSAVTERAIAHYLDNGYESTRNAFGTRTLYWVTGVLKRTDAGQSLSDALKAELTNRV